MSTETRSTASDTTERLARYMVAAWRVRYTSGPAPAWLHEERQWARAHLPETREEFLAVVDAARKLPGWMGRSDLLRCACALSGGIVVLGGPAGVTIAGASVSDEALHAWLPELAQPRPVGLQDALHHSLQEEEEWGTDDDA